MYTISICPSVRPSVGYYKVLTEQTDVAVKALNFISCDVFFESWAGHRFLTLA